MRSYILAGFFIVAVPLLGDGNTHPQTRLVDLNVAVVDKNGAPVTDLTVDDFAVSDAGKPQKLVFFHPLGSHAAPPVALSPGEFSNRNGIPARHATVILFDLLNERIGSRVYAWNQLVRYLGPRESSDNLYLYFLTLDGRLFAVHGLADPAAGVHEPEDVLWTRRIKPLMNQAMATVTRLRPVDIDVAVRVQLTYNALGGLAAQLARIPGRKNVVWITDGIPIVLGPRRSDTGDFVDFTPQLRQLSEVLHRFSVTIYPVRQVMLGGCPELRRKVSDSPRAI